MYGWRGSQGKEGGGREGRQAERSAVRQGERRRTARSGGKLSAHGIAGSFDLGVWNVGWLRLRGAGRGGRR